MNERTIPMDDRLDAECVSIQVDQTGKVWVNVNEKCVLRIGHVNSVIIDLPSVETTPDHFDLVFPKKG